MSKDIIRVIQLILCIYYTKDINLSICSFKDNDKLHYGSNASLITKQVQDNAKTYNENYLN